jgi:diguanylate cyclase (GGDEF)-like protein
MNKGEWSIDWKEKSQAIWRVSERNAHSATTEQASKWLSLLEIGAATVSLATIYLAVYSQGISPLYSEMSVLILLLGVFSLIFAKRVKPWMLHIQLLAGTAMVSYTIYVSQRSDPAVFTVVFFAWIVIYAYSFFSPLQATAHLITVFVGSALAFELGVGITAPLGDWLFVSGTAVVTATFTLRLVAQLAKVSHLDRLTGLPNRRYVEDKVWPIHNDFAIALIDLDDFKRLNDTEGHIAGDDVLQDLAFRWKGELRFSDTLARWGGDEFLLLMPGCSDHQMRAVLERLFDSCFPLSFSAGFTTCLKNETADLKSLILACDKALYQAKARAHSQRREDAIVAVR